MIKVQGVADTAVLMDMTESSMDNRVYERKGQEFTIRQALRLQQISGTTKFAEIIACESGGTFIKLPEGDEIDNESLLAKFNELYAEVGLLSAKFAEATKDGEIDSRERADLTAISDDMHRTMQELTGLMFRIYCRTNPDRAAA
jgi:hypothetical protein